MRHKVGQIVYLFDGSEMKIFPARIEEEIVRRKVGSEEVSYRILLPGKAQSVVELADLDVEIFETSSAVRDHMIENAIKTIDKIIEKAEAVSRTLRSDETPQKDLVRHEDTVV